MSQTRCVIYARYSTELQNPNSTKDQVAKCQAHAKAQGWTVIEAYEDAAISGAITQRPAYQQMLAGVDAGLVDIVLAEGLDRLSRDQAEVALLYGRCEFRDVAIHTLTEGRVSEIHIGFAGTMNAMQLRQIAYKTHRGISERVKEGRSGGGRTYGYRVPLDKTGGRATGHLEIDPNEAVIVQRIFREYADGASPLAIAAQLNAEGIPSPRGGHWKQNTINGNRQRGTGIINNELYIGVRVWNRLKYRRPPGGAKGRRSRLRPEQEWMRVEVPDLRIVDDALWDRVKGRQAVYAERLRRATDPQRASEAQALRRHKYLLSGLLRCQACGGRLTVAGSGRSKAYYCANAKEKGESVCAGMPGLRLALIEPLILDSIRKQLMTPSALDRFRKAFVAKVKRMEKELDNDRAFVAAQLREVNRDIARLKKLLMVLAERDLESSELLEALVEAEGRKDKLVEQEAAIRSDMPVIPDDIAELYRQKVDDLAGTLSNPKMVESSGEMLAAIIDRIEVAWDPSLDAHPVEVFGNIAALLGLGDEDQAAAYTAHQSSLKLVAGVGFEPTTFRL